MKPPSIGTSISPSSPPHGAVVWYLATMSTMITGTMIGGGPPFISSTVWAPKESDVRCRSTM
eukprot:scaffold77208_cov72-Phaeocystis_antarctica.AAC.2